MNSGKTTSLIQAAYNYEERGMKVAVVKPSTDTKGQDTIVSRLGAERKVDILLRPEDSVRKSLGGMSVKCVLVDEAQFVTPGQADELFWYAVEEDVPVMAYGLRTDFQTRGFPGATRLLELAHELQELKTICRCGHKAVFNGRLIDGEFVHEGQQVAIDGQEVEYESLCADDYRRLVLGTES
jgi:thymidine kinase